MVTFVNHLSVFEWCAFGCGCKNKHRKGMRLKEIRLGVHTMLTKISSIINMNWGGGMDLYDHLMSSTIFILTID